MNKTEVLIIHPSFYCRPIWHFFRSSSTVSNQDWSRYFDPHAPDRLTPSRARCAKLWISANSTLIGQKIGTFLYKMMWLKASHHLVFSKRCASKIWGGQWGPIKKNSTLPPWKHRKTVSSATFCATGAWELITGEKSFTGILNTKRDLLNSSLLNV